MNVLPPKSESDFVKYLLQHAGPHTTFVICGNRENFLDKVQCISPENGNNSENGLDAMESAAMLCNNSIGLLASSRSIKVVFTPTLSHLRAYLGVLASDFFGNDRHSSKIALFGLINVHRDTSDFSAQGLMRSMSLLSEAARVTKQSVVLAESPLMERFQSDSGSLYEACADPWKEKIPLLSSSVTRRTHNVATQDLQIECVLQSWANSFS